MFLQLHGVGTITAGTVIQIPEGLGSYHTYMGWQMITDTSSMQYKLREQAGMNFDEEGFGIINGRYVIACTATFGKVGDYIDFYKEDGLVIPCIIGDIKNQSEAGCNEWGHNNGQVIIEFIVDKSTWYNVSHQNPGSQGFHMEWNKNLTKAINGGSYFDNPNFDADTALEGNEESDSGDNDGTIEENDNANMQLKWPTDSTRITSEFGYRESPTAGASSNHRGIDIGVEEGTNVYACEAGTVTTAGFSESAGNWIVIDHGNGYVSKYMHNSRIDVSVGDIVIKGQIIGATGNTGVSTGPHLHFQIEYNGEAIDPLSFKYENGMGNGVGGIGSNSGSTSTTTQYYAKVATWKEITNITESNDPDVKNESNTTYSMTSTKVNYQDLVSGYTMPFDYLWAFVVMGQDKNFAMQLADLVYDSEIEITVHDNLTNITNVNTYTYTDKTKVVTDDVEVAVTYVKEESSNQIGSATEDGGPFEGETESNYETVKTTITKNNTLDISLTKADVWIVNYTQEYTNKIETVDTPDAPEQALEDIGYPSVPDKVDNNDALGLAENFRQQVHNEYKQRYAAVYTRVTGLTSQYYYSTINRKVKIVTTTETNKYISSPPNIIEKTDRNSKEDNFVTLFLKSENYRIRNNILSAEEWLFEILSENKDTANKMVDLTKYLLYKATGEDYGVTEFDTSMFDATKFESLDSQYGGKSGIDGVPGQIYDFLLGKGVPPIGAAAILGNIEGESSFDSTVVNSSSNASGLCQWTPGSGRLQKLQAYANSKGTQWTDVQSQIEFMWNELEGSYTSVKDVIMNTTDESDLEYATWYFGRYYEIFFLGDSFETTKDKTAKRYEYALDWYEQWQQKHVATGGNTVYYQNDYASYSYGTGTIATSGCGPTCFAMIASDYLGKQVTPVDAISWCGNKYYVSGAGTAWTYFQAATNHFNLPCTVVDLGNDINAAVDELKKGNLVISSQGPGLFTSGGHFIVLSSIDTNGGIKVRDPNKNNAVNKGYKDRVFTTSEISASAKNYWSFKK